MPSKEELDALIREALAVRHAAADDDDRATLARVTLGMLRLMIDPTGGVLGTLLVTWFHVPPPPAQMAQTIVDAWLDGRRDAPPFPQRPQMWPILASAFQTVWEPVPAAPVLGVLVDVCIGVLLDRYPAGPVVAKQGVAQLVARAYVLGV